ncbi:MAG: alpha/beta fold hydrolase [Kiritimatiellia bacterium]
MKLKLLLIMLAAILFSIVSSNEVLHADNQNTLGQGDYVVLLHGMGRTPRSMKKIEKQFLLNGFRVVNVAYPSTRAPIETLAAQYLDQAITTQCRQPDRKIHFVTHSLGGIVLEYYLQNHTLPNLGRVVMLCPPNQGSEFVDQWHNNILYRFFTGPAGQQLGTASSSLPNRLGAVTFELGVIAGDRTMAPLSSMLIPGANDGKVAVARTKVVGMKDFLVVHQTHTFIMRDREVINQAMFFINNGFFKRERVNKPQVEYALNYIPTPSWWPH